MRRKPTLLFHHLKKDITVHYVTYNRFFFLTDEIKSQIFGAHPNVCKITPQHIIMKNATYVHKCSKYCKDGRDSIIRVLAGTHCRQMGVIASVHVAKKYAYVHKLFFRLKDTKEQVFFFKGRNFSNYCPFLPIMLLLLEFHIQQFLRQYLGFVHQNSFLKFWYNSVITNGNF